MTPDRWRQIKDLFETILARDACERAAHLEQICGGDSALRAEVASLLAAYEEDPEFIERPAFAAGVTEKPATPLDTEDQRIGPYRVVQTIARGGMGTVYLAVRADDEYQKRVAVKIIREDRALSEPRRRAELMRRFRRERQTLANLDHPYIAKFLDGGTTEDGAPYLVMDYIEGAPIDAYCDTRRFSTQARLDLFRKVCAAVRYAHQNLIVHRDLKPGNILVTSAGAPKLLDFGIAKLLEAEQTGAAPNVTETVGQLMTPPYASPEQIRGQPITTASDVYSLGVVLYELLTGHRPYRLSGRPPHEVARIICEEEPEKPSTVITRFREISSSDDSGRNTLTPETVSYARASRPAQLRGRLSGDLDMIVLKALRKEPERRYASVEQLEEDLRRHLEGRPVLARRSTWAYRGMKFIRRNRAAVGTAIFVGLALIGGLAGTAWQARRAEQARADEQQQRRLAEAKADEAQRVTDFLVQVFGVADPYLGSALLTGDGDGEAPAPLAPAVSITAQEILRQGATRIDAELKGQPVVQAALMDALGQIHFKLGAYDEAERLLQNALEIRRQTLGPEHLDTAASLLHVAHLLREKGEYQAAEPLFRDVLALRRKRLGEDQPAVAASLYGLAETLMALGNLQEAETFYEQAANIYRKQAGPRKADLARTLGALADILQDQGKLDRAATLQREALETLRGIYGNDHPEVAALLNRQASLLQSRRDYAAAEPLAREVLRIYRATLGDGHPFVGAGLNNLGTLLERMGEFAEAERLLREALALFRRAYGPEHPAVASALNNLAKVRQKQDDLPGAAALFEETLLLRRKILDPSHPALAVTLNHLGLLHSAARQYAQAEPLFREALEIRRKRLGDAHSHTRGTWRSLAVTLHAQGKFAEAETCCRELLDIQRQALPAEHPDLADSLTGLGVLLLQRKQAAEAEPLLREAWEIRRRVLPADDWQTADSAGALGRCLAELQCYEEAEPLLREVYQRMEHRYGGTHARTRQARNRLIAFYEAWGKPEKIVEYRTEPRETGE